MPIELLALGTAVCTGLNSMVASEVAGRISVMAFTRWSMVIATVLLASAALALGGFERLSATAAGLLVLSSFFSVMLSAPAFYGGIFMIGPRLATLVFSLYAPLAALLGWLLLGERLLPHQLAGIGLVLAGVGLAVLYADPGERRPILAGGRLALLGLAASLLAAFGQAAGNLAAKPAMALGTDPIAGMAVRMGAGALYFVLIALLPFEATRGRPHPFSWRVLGLVALGTALGNGIGMAMMLEALKSGQVGIVSTLAATTPVVVLPMVWLRSGRLPGWRAWLGAGLAVAGTALVLR